MTQTFTACRRCIPTAILLLLLSTSGEVEAEPHPLFAVGRKHGRLRSTIGTSGPVAFVRCCAGISKRKLPRYRGRTRSLHEGTCLFDVPCKGECGNDSNDATFAGDDECDMSTRQARIVGPIAAAMAALSTSLPSFATPIASEAATAASLPNIATESSYKSSLAAFFPSSIPVSSLSEKVVTALAQLGVSSSNLDLLTSLCSDENNEAPNTLVNELRRKLGGGLGPTRRIGALAGLPLYAKSFDLCLNRDNLAKRTKILIVYGPHVGIGGSDGIVGKRGTGSCGSVLGAYTEMLQKMELEKLSAEGKISSPRSKKDGGDDDVLSLVDTPGSRVDTMREVQQDYIMQELQKRLAAEDLNNPDQNAAVRRVMETIYRTIDELLRAELDSAIKRNIPSIKDIEGGVEIILLGGIIIRGEVKGSEDLFKPLAFDSIALSNNGPSRVTNLLPTLLDTTTKPDESLISGTSQEERDLKRLEEEALRLEQEAEALRLEAEEAERIRFEYEETQKQQSASNDEKARVEKERREKEEEEERLHSKAVQEDEEQNRRESMQLALATKVKVPENSAMEPAAPSEGSNVSFGVAASSLFALSVGGIVAATSVSRDEDANTSTPPVPTKPRRDPMPTDNSPPKPTPKISTPVTKSRPPLISSKPTNPFSIRDPKSADFKEEGNEKVSGVTNTFPSLKPKESTKPLNDDYQSSSSEKYQKGFAPSYIDKLDEACDAGEASASVDDCAPAVKEYFDSVSKGEEKPSAEASDTISNYLEALSSQNKERGQARVVFPPQSGPAVESYLAKLATGEVKSPPSEGVSSYLDAVSSGATDTPKSAEDINAEINALMYSILETMRGPKLQALEEACDADEVTENDIDECAPAISEYIEAISGGEEELSSHAPEVIGGYLDKLSAENTSTNEGGRQGASPSEVSGAVQSYLNEVSTGGIGPPPGSGVSSYLEALSSGETTLPSSGEEIYTALDRPGAPRRSYAKAICEECTFVGGETRESCVAAISSYLDYVALMGSSVREHEADNAIVEFFEKTTRGCCGNAVLDYIGEVASSGKAPSAGSLLLYVNSLVSGRIKTPESGRYILLNLIEFENEGY